MDKPRNAIYLDQAPSDEHHGEEWFDISRIQASWGAVRYKVDDEHEEEQTLYVTRFNNFVLLTREFHTKTDDVVSSMNVLLTYKEAFQWFIDYWAEENGFPTIPMFTQSGLYEV